MFQSHQLIYIQMQKTGCTHIASLLPNFFDGVQIGKHNAATKDQIASDNYFLSSIRNPWDWYVSLWTFGVQGGGGLRRRLTTRNYFRAVKSMIKNPRENYLSLLYESSKDVGSWRDVYDKSANVESFRKWLKLIHHPDSSRCLGEGYGATSIGSFCGFMTYRYLYLCCQNPRQLSVRRSIFTHGDLVQFEKDNCYIDFFIRQESLENDLCEAIEKIRPLNRDDKELIYSAKKTNISNRELLISDHYDEESIELIRDRDRLLIEKFNYSAPNLGEKGAVPDRNCA